MSNIVKKWLVGFLLVVYVLFVLLNAIPGMISAPDTIQNLFGFAILVFSIPSIYVIIKRVYK
jgi:hypothetical protein